MHYDESANGRQIEAALNEELEIVLPETRTAGYQWVAKNSGEPVCQLLKETTEPSATVGGTGHHLWQFLVVASGTAEIKLHYLRPWETSKEPARTFSLKIRVRS
jgi:predicted secreted protein